METHQSYFTLGTFKVVVGGESAENWTDHQWNAVEQSFRSQARYALACTARTNQTKINKQIVFFIFTFVSSANPTDKEEERRVTPSSPSPVPAQWPD